MLSLNTGNIIIGPKKSKQNIKQNNIQQKHKILLFMRIRFHFTYNSISWFPDQLLLPINWFISICDDLCHFPPPSMDIFIAAFCGEKGKEKKRRRSHRSTGSQMSQPLLSPGRAPKDTVAHCLRWEPRCKRLL